MKEEMRILYNKDVIAAKGKLETGEKIIGLHPDFQKEEWKELKDRLVGHEIEHCRRNPLAVDSKSQFDLELQWQLFLFGILHPRVYLKHMLPLFIYKTDKGCNVKVQWVNSIAWAMVIAMAIILIL